jgi:hypothetical protein
MMDDTVTERRGRDQAPFRLVDVETAIRSGVIREVAQFLLNIERILFEMVFEVGHVGMSAFAFGGFAIGQKEIVPGI